MEIYYPNGQRDLSETTHLAIAAHPDDIELMAAEGICACFCQKDVHFTGVVVTTGSGSPRVGKYLSATDGELRGIRKNEQKKAATIGQYLAQVFLDYESEAVKHEKTEAVTDDLLWVLQRTMPDVVYLHNLADKHDTHVATALRAIEAMRQMKTPPKKVYGCEVWRSLDWLLDEEKHVADLSGHTALLEEAVRVFDSQIAGGKRYDLAVMGRRRANATFSASHRVDRAEVASVGMDLTPLVLDKTLSVTDYMKEAIARFQKDVSERLQKLQ